MERYFYTTSKVLFLTSLCFFYSAIVDSQTINICSYNKSATIYEKVTSDPSNQENSEAIQLIDRLVEPIGLPANFIPLKIDGIDNCAAITKNGLRFIVYDNKFLNALSSHSNRDWVKLSIFAHEIGHHLCGHTLYSVTSSEEQRNNELQADKFSGFLLQKLGAPLEDAIKGISIVGDINDSRTHPSKEKRIIAISEGYREAENQENSIVSKRLPSPEKFYFEALLSFHQLLVGSNYINVGVNSLINFNSPLEKMKLEKMEENLSTAINLNSKFIQAFLLRADIRLFRGNLDGSERDLKQVFSFDDKNIEALNQSAYLEVKKQNYQGALKYLDKALIVNPNNPRIYLTKGIVYSQMDKHEDAIQIYNIGLKIDNNYSLIYYNRGLSYLELKKIEEAKYDFLKDVELDPKHSDSYYYLGNIYSGKSAYNDAINAYSKAINIESTSYLYYCRGYSFAQVNKKVEAKSDFLKSIELDDTEFYAYFELGRIYLSEENYQDALKMYNKAIELKPENAKPYNYRGEIYVAQSNTSEALKNFNKSIELMPEYPFPYINRGYLYFSNKEYEKAVPDLERGYKLDPFGGLWLDVIWKKGFAKYQIDEYEGAYNDFKAYIGYLDIQISEKENDILKSDYWRTMLKISYRCAGQAAHLLNKNDEKTLLSKGCDLGDERCCKMLKN